MASEARQQAQAEKLTLLVAWVIVGENPEASGWLITGEIKCWPLLVPLYKWLVVRAFDGYGDSMVAAQQAAKNTGPPGPALL